MKKKSLLLGAAAVLLAGVCVYALRAELALRVAAHFAGQRIAANLLAELPDGLHVGLCGAGSPFPDQRRSGPCTAVVAGTHLFIFDAGSGSARNIGRFDLPAGRIEAIFLTHFHSDHLDGLGELMLQRWVTGAHATPVPVYGPAGVESVVQGFNQAYAADRDYRVAHHGAATVPPAGAGGQAHSFDAANGMVTVLKDGDLEIRAVSVDHAPVQPAVAYRIDYKGRSVLISGDTKKSAALQRAAQGVDLLVHEALSPALMAALAQAAGQAGRAGLQKVFNDLPDYHTTPAEAAQIAQAAGAGYLLLTHIAPPLPLPGMEKAFLGDAAERYRGTIRVGIDGDLVSLPAGVKEIRHSRRF